MSALTYGLVPVSLPERARRRNLSYAATSVFACLLIVLMMGVHSDCGSSGLEAFQ